MYQIASDRILAECFQPNSCAWLRLLWKQIFVVALLLIARKTFPAIPQIYFQIADISSCKWIQDHTTAKIDTNDTRRRVSCHREANVIGRIVSCYTKLYNCKNWHEWHQKEVSCHSETNVIRRIVSCHSEAGWQQFKCPRIQRRPMFDKTMSCWWNHYWKFQGLIISRHFDPNLIVRFASIIASNSWDR